MLDKAIDQHRQGQLQEAERNYRAWLTERPDDHRARFMLGMLFQQSGRAREALAEFDRVLAASDTAETHAWRGAALQALGRTSEAIQAYRDSLERAPGAVGVRRALGNLLNLAGDPSAAEAVLAPAADRGDPALLHELGIALQNMGRTEDAVARYRAALRLDPEQARIHHHLGLCLHRLDDLAEAAEAFRRALELEPGLTDARLRLSYMRAFLCDWRDRDAEREAILSAVERDLEEGRKHPVSPFLLNVVGAPQDIRRRAAERVVELLRQHAGPATAPEPPAPGAGPLRVAYLSPDLRTHAVGQLVHGLFARHDRERVLPYCYSLVPADDRIRDAVERGAHVFRDLSGSDPDEAVRCMREDGIHVLVDMGGLTQAARPEITVRRPAPVSVGWLGYLDTHGGLVDHLLADRVAVPESAQKESESASATDEGYSEAILRVPGSFLPATPLDATMEFRPPIPRSELGLRDEAVVLASFNHSYKLGPEVFDAWLEILTACPEAQLWCYAGGIHEAAARLRARAAEQGLDGRLVIAPPVPLDRHLARLPAADLILDTPGYNGGATSVTALMTGRPVLALAGDSMLSRMGPSLNAAMGLEELIAEDLDAYRELAIALVRDPERLTELQNRVRENLPAITDLDAFARKMEDALWRAWEE